MASLGDFRTDTKAINDGRWERVNQVLYGDLEILTRGFTDEFIDAQNMMLTRAAENYSGDQGRIPNATRRDINAKLLELFLVVDVRNLEDGDRPVTVDEFHRMLYDPSYGKLARACWEVAARVSTQAVTTMEAARGN